MRRRRLRRRELVRALEEFLWGFIVVGCLITLFVVYRMACG